MLATLVSRELLDHLRSLRFALMAALVVGLFAANGVIFAGSARSSDRARYRQDLRDASQELAQRAEQGLGLLAERGPGSIYRQPAHLDFCVAGRDRAIPNQIEAGTHNGNGYGNNDFSYSWHMPWNLIYHTTTPAPVNPVLPTAPALDWVLVVGMVSSLMAILLTYDAVSGERERGTLTLVMTHPVPRDLVLLAKGLAALLAITAPLLAGMSLSLLLLLAGGGLELSAVDAARLGLVGLVSLVYVGVFAGVGLLVSVLVHRPALGLLLLLLAWVLSVEVVPGGLGVLGMHLVEPPSGLELEREERAANRAFYERLEADLVEQPSPSQAPDDEQVLRDWAALFDDFIRRDRDRQDGAIDRQLARVRFARQLTRVSPTATYRYALEAIAGAGFPHYAAFVEAARRYRAEFIAFVQRQDRADPGSPHIYFVREGLSREPVDARAVPRFTDTYDLGAGVAAGVWDLVALVALAVLAFLAAHLAFLRRDLAQR